MRWRVWTTTSHGAEVKASLGPAVAAHLLVPTGAIDDSSSSRASATPTWLALLRNPWRSGGLANGDVETDGSAQDHHSGP
jgi:hypothetical protein